MTLSQLILQQKKFTSLQLRKLVNEASTAPFSVDPLTVDEPLWGSFWQFDVLAPGSTLPATELALLRAIRLDQSLPANTTLTQFLANLHVAIAHPQAGIWTTVIAGQACTVFAGGRGQESGVWNQLLVVWYCLTTGCLHAGYYTLFDLLHFEGMTVQRPLIFASRQNKLKDLSPNWLIEAVEQHPVNTNSLAAQLDAAILCHRHTTTL